MNALRCCLNMYNARETTISLLFVARCHAVVSQQIENWNVRLPSEGSRWTEVKMIDDDFDANKR